MAVEGGSNCWVSQKPKTDDPELIARGSFSPNGITDLSYSTSLAVHGGGQLLVENGGVLSGSDLLDLRCSSMKQTRKLPDYCGRGAFYKAAGGKRGSIGSYNYFPHFGYADVKKEVI
ncbi:hypothetical protein RHGRI_014160 [Rhododendron griersonianum]|uniref:Uncharacterized protein n=1 Tax=Rhododendron griersonianum TaxID=479676 RepID=A0AAV6K8B3_9ERIC|nr:hypothetical protein RHGRI_014160 [Rhododendron griersonianum]